MWLCVCWSLCCCDAQMLALRRSLWGYCPRSRGASTVPRLDRQPSVLAVGRALRSLLLSATVAAPRSPCCLLLCLCSFVSTVLVSVCPGVGVNIFEQCRPGMSMKILNSVPLRTPDGVVNLRPNAMSRPRKTDGLPKSPARSPPSSAARGPDGAEKGRILRTIKSSMTSSTTAKRAANNA